VNLPKVAFTSFASRFREPELKEGFEDIIKIDFKVSRGAYDEVIYAVMTLCPVLTIPTVHRR